MKSPYTRTIRTIYGSSRGRSPFFLERPQARHRVWLITLALVLLSAAVGASFYFFGQTGPAFTGDRVEVGLSGNFTPAVGKSEEYVLKITNKEEVVLTGVEVFIDFARAARRSGSGAPNPPTGGLGWPLGTSTAPNTAPVTLISADPAAEGGAGHTWKFSEIKPNEAREIKLNLSFLGREGLEITLPILATFRPSGWGGEFSNRLEQKFKLGKSLVDMRLNGPDKVAAGSELALSVKIKNPSAQLAEGADGDWLLSLSLPQGFAVIAFEPSLPSPRSSTGAGEQTWPLSALPHSGDSYALSIRGRVASPVGSELLLTALLANQKIASQISAEKKIIVKNTDIEFSLSAAPAQGKKTQWGETVNWQAVIRNAGGDVLRDAVISVSLSGEEFWTPPSLIIDNGGSWEAGNIDHPNPPGADWGPRVVWDKEGAKALSELSPGQKVALNFRFTLIKDPPALSGVVAILAAGRFTAASAGDQIEARSGEVSLKIAANIDLAPGAWYHPSLPNESPPLQGGVRGGSRGGGSGPHPPLPGQETVYGAGWTLGPSTGPLSEVRLALTLPPEVAWKQSTEAAGGELSYEQGSRTVVWRAAVLPRTAERKNIRFTIGLTPDDQVANDLIVLGATSFSAKDVFSGETLELYAPAVRLGEIK